MNSYKAQFFLFFAFSINSVFADWIASDLRTVDGLQVDRIRFVYHGDKLVKNGILRAAMRTKEDDVFIRRAFNEDLVSIVNLYKSHGYRSAQISRRRYQINSEGNKVRILIDIASGPLWHVNTLKINTQGSSMDSVLLEQIDLNDGMPLNYEKILEGERVIQVYLNQAGYPHAQVRNEWLNEDSRSYSVDILYNVDVGRKMYFGSVKIKNMDSLHTKPSLITSYVRLKTGQLYDPQKLAIARNELAGTDLFRAVLIKTPLVAEGDSIQPVFVTVEERNYKLLSANLFLNSSQRSVEPRLIGSVEHRNWLGRGVGIGVHSSWGRPVQGMTVSFTNRDVLRTDIDWVLTFGVNEEWNRKRVFADPNSLEQFQFLISYDSVLKQFAQDQGILTAYEYIRKTAYDYESHERLWSLRSVLSRRWKRRYEAQFSLSLSEAYNRPSREGRIKYDPISVADINKSLVDGPFVDVVQSDEVTRGEILVDSYWERILAQKTRSVSLASQFVRDTRDNRISPNSGNFVRMEGLYALELGGKEASVLDSEIEFRIYRRISSRFVFALAGQGVKIFSLRPDRSLPQLYWKEYGGEGSLRGVERNFIQVAGGGRIGLNVRSEIRGQWGPLGSVLFWDRAQVWARITDAHPFSWRGMVDGAGFGFRYVYGFPFRFDIAVNDGFDLSQRMRFYFSIGQAF